MIIGVIYKIQNKINNKIYIGQTIQKNPKNRFRQHIRESKYNKNNIFLYNSIKKYGEHNFEFSIIDTANTKEELNRKEIKYINYYNTLNENYGYNIKNGGQTNTYTSELGKRISAGKLKSNKKNGIPKTIHPNTKYIDFEKFELLIKENPKIDSKQLSKYFNIELNTFLKKIRAHYNLKLIEIRAKILNIEINEAKLTYKEFNIYEFLQLIKKGYKYYEIGYHFKQDLKTLKSKWKRWYPNKTFPDLQNNIDTLLNNYLKFGKPNGNYI